MSSGRLPCRSERAPVTGEARNCSSENSEPIRPEESGGGGGSAASSASHGPITGKKMEAREVDRTSEQHAVVFLLQRNPQRLPENVYRTLQSVIHAILQHRKDHVTPTRGKQAEKQAIWLCESEP